MAQTAIGGTFWRFPGWPNPAWVYDNAPFLCATPYKLGEMMAPNIPPIEMRSPGSRRGLGFISNTVDYQSTNGGGAPVTDFYMPDLYISPAPVPIISGGGGGGSPAPMPAPSPTTTTTVANPIFYDVNGNLITSATCGDVYGMTVPGYEGQILHLVQTKNGAPQFNGTMKMPMPNYPSVCNQDEGTYVIQAFTQSGQLLGSTTFIVNPKFSAAGLPSLPAATATPAAAPGTTSSTAALPAAAAPMPTTAPTGFLSGGLSNLTTNDWLILAGLAVLMYMAGTGSRGR